MYCVNGHIQSPPTYPAGGSMNNSILCKVFEIDEVACKEVTVNLY